jgi:hypothetical protein
MRLTWRDGVTTLLAGLVAAIALAVTQGWDWPLLGSERTGVAAIGVVGYTMCVFGTRASVTKASDLVGGPSMIAASALGAVALALIVAGLIAGSETIVVALAVAVLGSWLVATARHAVEGPAPHRGRLAKVH